ncbi:MAG: DUF1801 domain-containing protein [Cytophagales bacterium]
MEKSIDNFYLFESEPVSSCLLALKAIILAYDENIEASIKYGMPFFSYKGKMFCYLWTHKKFKKPYIGFIEGNRIEHRLLLLEKRARIKIILVDPNIDLPVATINSILKQAIELYKTGVIKVNGSNTMPNK